MTSDFQRAVARAAELADELSSLIVVLRATQPGATATVEVVDVDVLHRLIDGLGSGDEVFELVTSFGGDLAGRVERLHAVEDLGSAADAKRLLIDLRATSELFGAVGVAAWCRRRSAGEPASPGELDELVVRTRRALAVWRLTMETEAESMLH
jgi:hypothetical protein